MVKLDLNAKIKSKNAECLLNEAKQSNIAGCPVSLGVAIGAVIIAEQEAEERHAKEIKELIQSQARRVYMIQCDRADELQKLKDRAVEAFKSACSCGIQPGIGPKCERFADCKRYKVFTQKLNEK